MRDGADLSAKPDLSADLQRTCTRTAAPMIELRPYQHEGIAACREAMRAARRVLYVAPTG